LVVTKAVTHGSLSEDGIAIALFVLFVLVICFGPDET
jgi:hypothetical protein